MKFEGSQPRRILIFSTGSLGDTLLVVPAVRVLRQAYPGAELTLLCDVQAGSGYVVANQILEPAGLIDRTITYSVYQGTCKRLANWTSKLVLLARLRIADFDTLAYFVEAYSGDPRVARDRRFFRLTGVKRIIGMNGLDTRPLSQGINIQRVTSRVDELLERLAASGMGIPSPGQALVDLNLQPSEFALFEQWCGTLPGDGGRSWIGIGPGSKMSAKIWPEERFKALVQRLVDEYDLWPVVFGGPEDRLLGSRLVQSWGRGYIAAGALGVRVTAVGLSRCRFYVGNDTGTMHLAAAASIPCVALFSAREPPGRWEPYGPGHQVLRTVIDCAGCRLIDCVDRNKACLMRISVDDAYDACRKLLVRPDA